MLELPPPRHVPESVTGITQGLFTNHNRTPELTTAVRVPLFVAPRLLHVGVALAIVLVHVFPHVHKLVEGNVGLMDNVGVDLCRGDVLVIGEGCSHLQQRRGV